jgi:NAD(P)-dependent dehydrogenase (short-subunit alcohol dehydrogenase family)
MAGYHMSRLDDKVAIVTGTSPNIGGILASGLAHAGAWVACNDINADHARTRVETITAAGGDAMAIPFDVTDFDAARSAVDAVLHRFGRIDLLVNNAVKFDMGGVRDMDLDRFRRQVDIIIGGAFIMTKLVANAMVERGIAGSVINVLSTAAWQGQAGNVGYSTAKSGLINFTRSVAMELAPHRIRVNSLTPTATMPDDPTLAEHFTAAADTMARRGTLDFRSMNPWERLPTPADYVGPVVFLASDDAALVTGTNLTVDGGALAKYWPQSPARNPTPS